IVNEKAAYFIPTEVAAGSNVFKTWANGASKKKIVFDVKKVFVALLHKEIYLTGVTFDMFLASYLLNPAESHHNIPAIANREGKKNVLFDEEVYGKGTKLKVPEQNELADHVIRKTKLLYELKDNNEEQKKENEQLDLIEDNEMTNNIPTIENREGKKNVLFDEEVYGKGTKLKVPEQNELADHVIRKTKLLYELKDNIEEQLKENEQFDLFEDLELPLARILAE